jgi:hypothetical protein
MFSDDGLPLNKNYSETKENPIRSKIPPEA